MKCRVMENEIEGNAENARRIDWMKNGELVNVKVRWKFQKHKKGSLKDLPFFTFSECNFNIFQDKICLYILITNFWVTESYRKD